MDYDNAKKPRSDQQQQRRSRAVVLLLVLTNAASILVFFGVGAALHAHVGRRYPALHPWGSSKSTWILRNSITSKIQER